MQTEVTAHPGAGSLTDAVLFLGQRDSNQTRAIVGPYRCCLLQDGLRRAGLQAALVGLITIISLVIKHRDLAGL